MAITVIPPALPAGQEIDPSTRRGTGGGVAWCTYLVQRALIVFEGSPSHGASHRHSVQGMACGQEIEPIPVWPPVYRYHHNEELLTIAENDKGAGGH